MKDYTISPEEKGKFIVRVYREDNDTLSVEFADGSFFRNIEASDANLRKIEMIQEAQAKQGVKNYRFLKRRTNLATAGVALTIPACAVVGVGLSNLIGVTDPTTIFIGSGVLTILGTIPASVKLVRTAAIQSEVHKVMFRNKHRAALEHYREYPNALEGVQNPARYLLENEENPFSIMNIDDYTEDDLRLILSNMEKEEEFQFSYKPTSK